MKRLLKKIALTCVGLSIVTSSYSYGETKTINTENLISDSAVTATTTQAAYASDNAAATTAKDVYSTENLTTTQATYTNEQYKAYVKRMDALNNIEYLFNGITLSYPQDIDYKKMKINVLKAMISSLDPYSVYMEQSQAANFIQQLDSKFVGIGVVLQAGDKDYVIKQVIKGSPAEKAAIHDGDIIYSVDGKLASKFKSVDELSSNVRGKEGTKLKLVVIRNSKKYNFTVARAEVVLPSVYYKELSKDIGYLQIGQISIGTYKEFKKAEDDFKSKGIKKIILDLRGNGGGRVDIANQICRDIIPKGKIASEEYTGSPKLDIMSDLKTAPFKFAVLIDQDTASSAEYIAGAIQDRGVGILVGNRSFGKSIIQEMFGVSADSNGDVYFTEYGCKDNIASIKLTTGKYYTPNGTFINGKGLKPAAYVQYSSVYDYDGAKAFDYKAALKLSYKNGMKNSIVKGIEQKLKLLGYTISPDDTYDKDTTNCLNKYQHDKKLKVKKYGSIDEVTLKKLDADIKALSTHDLQFEKAEIILKGFKK